MKVADLTVDELQALIRKVLHEELQGIIADPDRGLELAGDIQARIEASLVSSERIPFEEAKKRMVRGKRMVETMTGKSTVSMSTGEIMKLTRGE